MAGDGLFWFKSAESERWAQGPYLLDPNSLMNHPATHKVFVALQHLIPRRLVTHLAARLAASRTPWLKSLLISSFIRRFKVDMSEALYPSPEDYSCFNEFFTRPLKAGARPLGDSSRAVLCPADGAISEMGSIYEGRLYQAKGRDYTALDLLGGDPSLADHFLDGSFATVYLSPKDYHRVHMPLAGTLERTQYIPGDFFSVNRATANHLPQLFARNERMVTVFDTDLGKVALVLVGALIVAGIDTVWGGGPQDGDSCLDMRGAEVSLQAGEEMGRFYLGSTAILLFEKDRVEWDSSLRSGSSVRMGQELGMKATL